jgi:hypothetical protein
VSMSVSADVTTCCFFFVQSSHMYHLLLLSCLVLSCLVLSLIYSGFSNAASCSSGGYIQSVNWFPLDQCMWFDYYGQYVMFSSCTTESSAISYSGTVGNVVRTTYTDSACTANPVTSTLNDDCSVPDSAEPVLIESYLTQCSSQCSSSVVTASSSSCGDSNTSQVNATLGLSTTIFILMMVFVFLKGYEMFFKKTTYNKDNSMNSSL